MSIRAKRFVALAALAALVVAWGGTVQAAVTSAVIPNYALSSWTTWDYWGNPVTTPPLTDGQMTGMYGANNLYPNPDYFAEVLGSNTTVMYGWNPTAADFPTAGGNGMLPGTAAGSVCTYNAGTFWQDPDVGFVPSNVDGSDAYGGPTIATIQANKRYTFTIAIGSALTAVINNGNSIAFADMNYGGLIQSKEHLNPNGYQDAPQGPQFFQTGTFGDISFSLASQDFIGAQYKVGDKLTFDFNTCAGTAWSNARLISQNWYPLYTSASSVGGTVTWDAGTTSAWSATQGGPYTGKWNQGLAKQPTGTDPDAVFDGPGGTVNVTGNVAANSLNFFNDVTMASYTLQGSGTVTLTGDALISSGAGTSVGTNLGAGTNTISCVLAGSVGMYKAGAGTLILTGNNTFTGGVTVGGATLQIGNGGTTGNIGSNNVTNLANLAFNRSDTITYGGVISGTGSVDLLSGTTVFTGNHTYSGITTIHNGATLQLGNGGTSGSLNANSTAGTPVSDVYVNGATAVLAFNRSTDVAYAGRIFGSGGVTQQGTNRVTLTDSQTTYSGATTVQSGALQINAASTTMSAGSTMNVLNNAGGVNNTGGFLVLDYSAKTANDSVLATAVQSALKTAYNNGTNSFQTGQIRDTSATSSVGLGWVDNTTTHQITIMPALYGDANLDGKVNFTDLSILLSNYGKAGTFGWSQGDFNYDSTVNFSDLSKLLSNYSKSGPLNIGNIPNLTLDSQALQLLASDHITISGASPVPEPSSLVMLASLAALAGAWRIRRQRSR